MAVSVEAPKQINVDQQAESYNEANALSPMAQYGETPMALWQSVPIAPPLPSGDNIAPPDFTENFVQRCLYPSQTFLVSEGLAPEEPKPEEKSPEKPESPVKEASRPRTPKAPREPQPDYFGHLLGHPLSAEEDEDSEQGSVKDESQVEVKAVENSDAKDEQKDEEKAASPENVDEVAVNDAVKETEDIQSSGPTKSDEKAIEDSSADVAEEPTNDDAEVSKKEPSEPESSEDGDDNVDYFGYIMGHPMNRGTGSRKVKKARTPVPEPSSPAKEEPKKEAESQDSQPSVLGLFLGGVEVCDREENIGQFTSRGDEPVEEAADERGEEDIPTCAKDEQPPTEEKACEEVSAAKIEESAEVPEPAETSPADVRVEEVPTTKADEPSEKKPVEKTEVKVEKKSDDKVEDKPAEKAETPAGEKQSEKRSNEVIGASNASKKPAKKSRSFLGGLCGSKTMD